MAEHPPVPQRRRQQRPQPAAQQRPGGPHNTSPGGTGSGVADASWPARKAVAAKPAWRSTAGAGVAARTAAPTAAPAQQPQPQPQQSRAAQPAQPDDAAAPEASAPQPATDAAAPAPVTTADPPVVQQPPAVATAPARAPWATGMALSAAGAAGAAAAATGAAAASALNGDDGAAYDQAVELDRQAAWAGPEARAADAAEWEARQAKPSHATCLLRLHAMIACYGLTHSAPSYGSETRCHALPVAPDCPMDEAVPSPAGWHGSLGPLFKS